MDTRFTDSTVGGFGASRRLAILKTLATVCEEATDATVSLNDLADAILNRSEWPAPMSEEQMQIRLHHVDLPKLATTTLLDYDAETNTIQYRGPTGDDGDEALAHFL